ncbi:MAG: TetR/AcrR family transcriptional regulator [Beijerinckiaceae bacterium]
MSASSKMPQSGAGRRTRTAGAAPPRRQRRKEARPAEIFEAGLQEFALYGYAGTRLENVARRAGIVKGTIYRYFADKEALFLAAVRSRVAGLLEEIGSFAGTFDGTTQELLTVLLKQVYTRLVDSDLHILVRIIVGESGNFPQLSELYYREVVSKGRPMLDVIIRRGIARGEIRSGAAAELPIVMMAPALMAAIWKMTFNRYDEIATEKFLAAHVDLVLHGLLTPQAQLPGRTNYPE